MAREMKDSGVEWIGQIPKEWKVIKLKKIMTFLNGYAFEGNRLSFEGKYPVIRIGDIFNNKIDIKNSNKINLINDEEKFLEKFLIKQNDILIAMSGATVGKLAFIDDIKEKVYINQRVGILRSNMNKYLFYSLANNMFLKYIYLLSIGSAQPNISSVGIENYIIAIPSLEEQEKIANYLDKKITDIDLIIEKTKTTIEDYKKYKQSIITETVTKGLNPNVEMKDSGIEWIGQIPKHWEVTKVKNIAYKVTDGAHVSPEIENGIYDFVSTVNLKNNCIDFDNCLKTSEKSYAQLVLNNCNPKKNDVLISKDGTVGKTVVIDFDKEFIVASSLVIIRTNTDLINPYFLNYNLKSKYIQDYLILLMVGAGLKRVSVEKNANLLILMPPLEEQQQIAEYLDKKIAEIDNLIAKKESLISEMEEYKKSLIYECVTGKKEII